MQHQRQQHHQQEQRQIHGNSLPFAAVAPNLRAALFWASTAAPACVTATRFSSSSSSSKSKSSSASGAMDLTLGTSTNSVGTGGTSSTISADGGVCAAGNGAEGFDGAEAARNAGDDAADNGDVKVVVDVFIVGSIYLAGSALALLSPGGDGQAPG
mmetsp:Transcript_65906/g.132715  ORF Transcript_65906/g.132715 Transcript_65906/m.132715 type:complete len:156 (+) Transcript_65906:1407-1874(+)